MHCEELCCLDITHFHLLLPWIIIPAGYLSISDHWQAICVDAMYFVLPISLVHQYLCSYLAVLVYLLALSSDTICLWDIKLLVIVAVLNICYNG